MWRWNGVIVIHDLKFMSPFRFYAIVTIIHCFAVHRCSSDLWVLSGTLLHEKEFTILFYICCISKSNDSMVCCPQLLGSQYLDGRYATEIFLQVDNCKCITSYVYSWFGPFAIKTTVLERTWSY